MGHWNNILSDYVERRVQKEEKARDRGEILEPDNLQLDQFIPLENTASAYIQLKLPGRKVPTGEEFEKLKKIRETAFNNYVASTRRKEKILIDANRKYGKEVADRNGQKERECFIVANRIEQQHVPYMENDETVNKYLEDYLGDNTTPATRRRMMLQNIKNMIQKAENNPLLDLNQDDEYLAAHYSEIYSLIGPSIQQGSYIDILINELKKDKQISENEEKEYRELKSKVDKIFGIQSILTARFNTILSPLFPYLGTSNLSYLDSAKLADIDDLPREFLSEDGDVKLAYSEFDTDFNLEFDNEIEARFKNDHPELFTPPAMMFSPDRGSHGLSSILKSATFWINEKVQKDGKLVPGRWRKFLRADDGTLNETEVTPEDSARMQVYYDAVKNDENTDILGSLNLHNVMLFAPDGKTIHKTIKIYDDRESLILTWGGFYYVQKNDNGKMDFHHVALNLETGKLSDRAISHEERKELLKNYARTEGLENLTGIEAEIFASQKILPTGITNNAMLDGEVSDLRELLRSHTRTLHSNAPYKNVEAALDDYYEISNSLSTEENILMLRRIGKLAEIYISGIHKQDRIQAMLEVAERIRQCADGLERLREEGLVSEKKGKALNGAEPLRRTLRRSMRNQPFDADTFALWKATGAKGDRFKNTAAIKNSEAVLFMAKNLNGNIKDEKELDRIYNICKNAFETITKLSEKNDPAFVAAYNEILANNNKAWKTGDARFDKALHEQMMQMINRDVLSRNMDIVPGKPAPAGTGYRSFSYSMRDRIIDAFADPRLREYSKFNIDLERTEQHAKAALANSVFGTDYEKLASSMPLGYGQNNMPFAIVTCFMLDAGFSLDEIMNPDARADEKRDLGRKIMNTLEAAKNGDEELNAALNDRIIQSLAKHGEELLDYKPELTEHVDLDHREDTLNFAGSVWLLRDGMSDAFSWFNVKSDIWSPEKQTHTCEVFHSGKETPEATKARITGLISKIDIMHAEMKRSYQTIKSKGTLYDDLRHEDDTFDTKKLSENCINIIINETLIPFIKSMNKPSSPEKTALSAYVCNNLQAMSNSIAAILQQCPVKVLLALATTPSLRDRLQIAPNPEYLQSLAGNTTEEKQENLRKDLESNQEKIAQFLLWDKEGRGLKVSANMLKGTPGPEDKALMTRFNNSLLDYCARKERKASDKLLHNIENTMQSLPESMQDCGNLFAAAPEAMTVILRKIKELMTMNYNKRVGSYYSHIIVGDRNGKDLVPEEAARRGMDYAHMETYEKNILLASVCAAALKKGLKVSMVGANPAATVTDLNMAPEIHELGMPKEMPNSKAADSALSAIWNGMSASFTKRKTKAESINAHRKTVDKAKAKVSAAMNLQYLEQHAELKEISTLKVKEIAASEKAATDMIKAVLGDRESTVKDFVFGDKTRISRRTAIIAIAYGLENQRPDLMTTERFTFTGNEDKMRQQRERLEAAANMYSAIVNTQKKHPREADNNLRNLLSRGLHGMGKSLAPKTIPDMGEYVTKYAADLKARRELTRLVMKSNAPVNFGTTRDEKARTMKDWQMTNNTVIADCDQAAEEYLLSVEKVADIYKGKIANSNLEALQQSAARQSLLMHKLSAKPKMISFKEAESNFNDAQTFAMEYSRGLKNNPNVNVNDFASAVKFTFEKTNDILKTGEDAVEFQKMGQAAQL